MSTTLTDTSNREILITRLLNAPRELVWDAWTKPEHVKQWWGPNGFTNTIHEMEVKPGGVWRFMMHGPNGIDFPNFVVFEEVIKPEKLVYAHRSEDKESKVFFRTTVTFEQRGKNKTWLTMRVLLPTQQERDRVIKEHGAVEGGKQTINKLEQYLTAMNTMKDAVIVEKTYAAPVEKVWKAITDLEQMKQWYFDIPAFKPEVGFEFQFYGTGKTGEKFLHLCKITDVIVNKKLRHSWQYEGYEGNSFVTIELFEENGNTRVRLTHEGLETFPKTAHNDFAKANFVEGWNHILGISLKEFAEKK